MDELTRKILGSDESLKRIHDKIDKIEDWKTLSKNPMVTICMATFNHENFIVESLEGILNQKVDFEYEIIIKEDKSTDRTRDILIKYQKEYSSKIRLWLCKENLYSQRLKPKLNAFARGKYIARCEGDDYWIDPLKLKKQVSFLEDNEDYNFSLGRVDVLFEDGTIKSRNDQRKLKNRSTLTIEDYIRKPFSQTSSFLYRNLKIDFPEWINFIRSGDQVIVLLYTGENGKIKYHNELLSIYRVHKGGVTQQMINYEKLYKESIFFLDSIDNFFNYKYSSLIKKRKRTLRLSLKSTYYDQKKKIMLSLYYKILFYINKHLK